MEVYNNISIIIPVYGHSEFVLETVNSAINQKNVQIDNIIVVIDGDKSSDLVTNVQILNFCNKKITTLYKKNGGLSSARNYGVNYLKKLKFQGWVFLFDADNRLTSNALYQMLDYAINNKLQIVSPCLDMFGVIGSINYSHRFNPVSFRKENHFEAG